MYQVSMYSNSIKRRVLFLGASFEKISYKLYVSHTGTRFSLKVTVLIGV